MPEGGGAPAAPQRGIPDRGDKTFLGNPAGSRAPASPSSADPEPVTPCCRPCAATLLHWASSLLCVCAQGPAPLPGLPAGLWSSGRPCRRGTWCSATHPSEPAHSPYGLGTVGGLGPGEKVGIATQLPCCEMSIAFTIVWKTGFLAGAPRE